MNAVTVARLAILTVTLVWSTASLAGENISRWQTLPRETKPLSVSAESATLQQAGAWAYLIAPVESVNADVAATVTIDSPATGFDFFGSSWSAWPDPKFGDQGFEAALLLRGKEDGSSGYRVQLSSKLQEVALVRFPDGGYLRSAPCAVKTQTPIKLRAIASGNVIRVLIDGREVIRYIDRLEPVLDRGRLGIGVSSAARVSYSDLKIETIEAGATPTPGPHQPKLSARKWLGGRVFVFDHNEPILQLQTEQDPSLFAKLRPGHKPQLTFDSHWGLENQGAFNEAASKWTAPEVSGEGESLQVRWSARHVKDRFTTSSQLTVGYDAKRDAYTYDIDSVLEVLPGEPFHFRYGFDFEHHTPLDPFNWQYVVARRRGGELYHRPVTPVDPGPQYDLETYHGLRLWYGRHSKDLRVAPAVEYEISPEWNQVKSTNGDVAARQCNTAVCAAFYDTGVAFAPETVPSGTKVRVKYRYTGYPADEAKRLFEQSKIYPSATLDRDHHYIFADEWPKLTFSQFVPLSEPWIYGRTPFMTGHNQRPTYKLVKTGDVGSGFAMKLGPASFGKATLVKATPLPKGRYVVTSLAKCDNVLGPGGRIELEATKAKTNEKLMDARHFVGNGSFDWRKESFVVEVREEAAALTIAFGNSGTGDFLVTDVQFQKLADGESLPAGVQAKANDQPAAAEAAPAGAIADFRMLEGKGHYVLNHAGGEHLALANLQWVEDEGRPALSFAENITGQKNYDPASLIGMHIFGHAQDWNYRATYRGYEGRETVPFALGGGGGIVLGAERYYLHGAYYRGLIGRTTIFQRVLVPEEIQLLSKDKPLPSTDQVADSLGITLAAWIKPAADLGKDIHPGGGDIIGYGHRRFILKLLGGGDTGTKAPYRLAARLNVNDGITTDRIIEGNRWYHVALTAAPENGQRRMRLFLDGKQVAEGLTAKWSE